jgi:hypothetical protein
MRANIRFWQAITPSTWSDCLAMVSRRFAFMLRRSNGRPSWPSASLATARDHLMDDFSCWISAEHGQRNWTRRKAGR